jgi:hypothetical protein
VERRIYAVHDRDLKQFLTELNLLDKITKGEIKCPECDCTITLGNVGFITISKGEAKVCCDDIECFYKLRTRIRKVKKDETSEPQPEVVEAVESETYDLSSKSEEAKTDEA